MIPLYIMAIIISFTSTLLVFNSLGNKVFMLPDSKEYCQLLERRLYQKYALYITCTAILPLLISLLVFTKYAASEILIVIALTLATWLYSVRWVSLIAEMVRRLGRVNTVVPAIYMSSVINVILLINFH